MFVENPALAAGQGILVHQIVVDGDTLNNSPAEVKSVSISYVSGKHDQASITTKLTKKQAKDFLDKPILFTYGPKTRRDTFHGYVSVIRPSRKYQEDLIYDIICLGVTEPMQTGGKNFWTNRTVPEILGEVVTSHGLGFASESHPFRWPSLAQTGWSDWELVKKLAALCGFNVVTQRGVVRLIDAAKELRSTAPVAHLVKGDQILGDNRELLDFTPSEESTSIRKNIHPIYSYFDRDGVPQEKMAGDGELKRHVTSVPILSRDMAEVYAKAWERLTDFWVETAQARIKGNTRIFPGELVAVSLNGSSVIFNDYDGLWMVVGVTHTLTHNSFQTNLSLARDKVRLPANTSYKEFYSNVRYGRPRVLLDTSKTDSRWKSSWPHPVISTPSMDDPMPPTSTPPWIVG